MLFRSPIEYCVQLGVGTARALLPAETRRSLRKRLLYGNRNGHVTSPRSNNLSQIFSQDQVDLYTTNVVFKIDKARRVLDYDPQIDFSRGMELTSAWINWARL